MLRRFPWMDRALVLVLLVVWTLGVLRRDLVEGRFLPRSAAQMRLERMREALRSRPASDPLASVSLPAGVRVDASSGLLVGLSLQAEGNAKPLPWQVLETWEPREDLRGIPETISARDGEEVLMVGFVLSPFAYEDIREFLLVASHWSCCYGRVAGLEGVVHVRLAKDAEGLPLTLQPVKVTGRFRVGAIKEGGLLLALYRIEDAQASILTW